MPPDDTILMVHCPVVRNYSFVDDPQHHVLYATLEHHMSSVWDNFPTAKVIPNNGRSAASPPTSTHN